MSADNAYFEKRLKRIARTHGRLERRATRKVVRNGLIEVRPRIFVPKLPIKGVLMMLVAGFAFKAYVMLIWGVLDMRSVLSCSRMHPAYRKLALGSFRLIRRRYWLAISSTRWVFNAPLPVK